MAINFDENRSGILGINNNINSNQMAFVPNFLKTIFSGKPEDIPLGEEGSPIDKAKDALEKNKKMLEEAGQGGISSLDLPPNNLTAMAIANYDDLFAPETFTDALGVNRTIPGFTRPDINTKTFNINEVASDGIANNVRFRDMLFNDLRNLPGDFRTSLGTTRDALTKDFSGLTNFLTGAKNKTFDVGSAIARGIGNLVIPGAGFLLSAMKETPEQKLLKDFYEQETGLDNIGRIQSGIMQGYNPVSMFGSQGLTSAINKRLATILETEEKKKKKGLKLSQELINRRKELEALKEKEEAARRSAVDRMFQEGKGGRGQDFTGGRFDRAGSREAYDRDPTGFSGSS